MFSDWIKFRIVFRMPKSSIKEQFLIAVVLCSYRRVQLLCRPDGPVSNDSAVAQSKYSHGRVKHSINTVFVLFF